MTSERGGEFRLNVLNPGGRDPEQHFTDGAGEISAAHAPVNFHAYAACTRGSFFRESKRAIAAGAPVLLLLRGDFRASERALAELQKAKVPVMISLKETGLHQIAAHLRDPGRLERFRKTVRAANGCIAPTPEAADLYRNLRGDDAVAFIPTPYPVHDSRWDFSRTIDERRGIFIGTREWDVPSRNHCAALIAAKRVSEITGEPVTVFDFDGRTGARALAAIGFDAGKLNVLTKRHGYADYLRVVAQHKIVFQLDSSFVPGQVAGDALLGRVPCVGGNGAIERIAFPDLCSVGRSAGELIATAVDLLGNRGSSRAMLEPLSFSHIASELETFAKQVA